MNKKLIIIGSILLLLVSMGFATQYFITKTEALNYFSTYKTSRESDIQDDIKIAMTLTYSKDKICTIDYNTEEISCEICYTYEQPNNFNLTGEDCVGVSEDSTQKEEKVLIEQSIAKRIRDNYPIEEIQFMGGKREGKKVEV